MASRICVLPARLLILVLQLRQSRAEFELDECHDVIRVVRRARDDCIIVYSASPV